MMLGWHTIHVWACHLGQFDPRGSPCVILSPTVLFLGEKLIMYFFPRFLAIQKILKQIKYEKGCFLPPGN
jgi:hypothetical protein